ncbi:MAG: nucleoside hydrolase, partial [Thermodesulfobacteriota bacterium]|nr:nucleoside hydrolase [Thermodesulfobacteriota bacterium]
HTHKITLLIDTDMALDDIRALTMILNLNMINISLMVTSDGAVSPRVGYNNLRQVLEYFKKEKIPIAIGRTLSRPAPPWRSWSEDLNLPKLSPESLETAAEISAAKKIVETLNNHEGRVVYLCLGPLINLADALQLDKKIKEKISRVIFFGAPPDNSDPDWNYLRDSQSADLVFKSGLTVYTLSISKEKLLRFDKKLYNRIKMMDTPATHFIINIHETPVIKKLLSDGHFRIWDEMTAIYLYQPSLFRFTPAVDSAHLMNLLDFRADKVLNVYLKLLGYPSDFHLSMRNPVTLKEFPTDPFLFREDIRPYVKKIIARHGLEEWKACLLTNEFHQHLGIYSIIGAKMGTRAREILETPFDHLEVISWAGNAPPLSCMNDGLQVATGASLGRGTIKISSQKHRTTAIFIYKNRKLILNLKEEVKEMIKADIQRTLKEFGGLNSKYFAHIRELSLDYWWNLDRKEIFDEILN